MHAFARIGLTAVLTLLICHPAKAQAPTVGVEQRLSDHIRILSSDDFEGRRPGTEGEARTLAYLQAQYQALGLQPGAEDGGWTQTVSIARMNPVSRQAAWTGPRGAGRVLTPGPDILLRALTTGRGDVRDLPVVFAGYGVSAPERNWDDYAGLDVRGKLVLVTEGEPPFPALGATLNTTYNTARYKEAEAFRRGAAAVLLVIPVGRGEAMWTNRAAYQTVPLTVMARDEGLALSGQINRDEVADMMAAAGLDAEPLFQAARAPGFRATPLPGVTFSGSAEETREISTTRNFLARLPGATHADETVLLLAHWDHLGKSRTPDANGDDIFNGAWDNASGNAGLIELARAMAAGDRPARSIVFLHTTAEETGLIGASWYAAHPIWPLETTAAALNLDMIPLTPPTRDISVTGLGRTTLDDDFAVFAVAQGMTPTPETDPGQGLYQRTDHFPLAEAGVPALTVKGGVDLVEGGRAAGEPMVQDLWRAYYHSRDDEWRADYAFGAALQLLGAYEGLIRRLAQPGVWPQWKPTAEFGAARALSHTVRDRR